MNEGTNTERPGASLTDTFDDHDFVTCVHLNHKIYPASESGEKNDKVVYHGIYVSQLYGTMFAIYGSFDIREDRGNACCYLTRINLKLLNYKGLVNLGFYQESMVVNSEGPNKEKKEVKKITIPIQALSGKYQMEIILNPPIKVQHGTFERIVFERLLYPINGFGVDPAGQTNIHIVKEVKGGAVNPTPIPDLPYFDTEFHYRDGVDYYDQLLLPGKKGYRKPGVFSVRCIHSNVNIAYF